MKRILAFILLFIALRADATIIGFATTNSLGQPDTNLFRLWSVSQPDAYGNYIQTGIPLRMQPNTNGYCQTNLLVDNYVMTNQIFGSILFRVLTNDTGPQVYPVNGGVGSAIISGNQGYPGRLFSTFVTYFSGNGTNIIITQTAITNALGYQPLQSNQVVFLSGDATGVGGTNISVAVTNYEGAALYLTTNIVNSLLSGSTNAGASTNFVIHNFIANVKGFGNVTTLSNAPVISGTNLSMVSGQFSDVNGTNAQASTNIVISTSSATNVLSAAKITVNEITSGASASDYDLIPGTGLTAPQVTIDGNTEHHGSQGGGFDWFITGTASYFWKMGGYPTGGFTIYDQGEGEIIDIGTTNVGYVFLYTSNPSHAKVYENQFNHLINRNIYGQLYFEFDTDSDAFTLYSQNTGGTVQSARVVASTDNLSILNQAGNTTLSSGSTETDIKDSSNNTLAKFQNGGNQFNNNLWGDDGAGHVTALSFTASDANGSVVFVSTNILDSGGNVGGAGKILTSTGTKMYWSNAPPSLSLVATKQFGTQVLTNLSGTGAVTNIISGGGISISTNSGSVVITATGSATTITNTVAGLFYNPFNNGVMVGNTNQTLNGSPQSTNSGIFEGLNNQIGLNSRSSVIAGGSSNTIQQLTGFATVTNVSVGIFSGATNTILGAQNSAIAGGYGNWMANYWYRDVDQGFVDSDFIGAGSFNSIWTESFSMLGGLGASMSFIGAGTSNSINATGAFIGAGIKNEIDIQGTNSWAMGAWCRISNNACGQMSDGSMGQFNSITNNTLTICYSNGVAINTNQPGPYTLFVNGSVNSTNYYVNGVLLPLANILNAVTNTQNNVSLGQIGHTNAWLSAPNISVAQSRLADQDNNILVLTNCGTALAEGGYFTNLAGAKTNWSGCIETNNGTSYLVMNGASTLYSGPLEITNSWSPVSGSGNPVSHYGFDLHIGGAQIYGIINSTNFETRLSTSITNANRTFFIVSGSPNTVITATRPAMCYTELGGLWIKTNTVADANGWRQLIADGSP